MTMKWKRLKAARVLGAAGVATLMVFAGLAPAASADTCSSSGSNKNGGTNINFRNNDGCKSGVQGLKSKRYSSSSGEIMWQRTPGAVKYQIIRNGKSLGTHDVLSWHMTDLQDRGHNFEVRAIDRYGNKSEAATVYLPSPIKNRYY